MIKVTKRNGKKEPLMLDKILDRINQQTYGLDQKWVVPFEIAQKVIEGITPDIETRILDQLAMETAATLTTKHPDYATLAARLAITALHKETKKVFSETIDDLYNYIDPKTKKHLPIVSKKFYDIVKSHSDQLDSAIVHSRDHNFDYFGYKVLEKSYLLKINNKVAERPQYMYMRTAIQIWGNNIQKVIETYNLMSEGYYTHATPTLFNSGTTRTQLSSCFVAGTSVFTTSGPKNIEDICIGDKVVTHLGNVKPVVQLHKNELSNRKVFNVKILGTPEFKVTDNHRFWSISKEQLKWGMKPTFNSIEYLRQGDYISIPNKKEVYTPIKLDIVDYLTKNYGDINLSYEDDDDFIIPVSSWKRKHKLNKNDDDDTITITRKHTPIKREILIDEDFSFIVGIWLGDGHIISGKDKGKTERFETGIGITIHKDNYHLISELQRLIFKVFGIKSSVTAEQDNVVQVQVHSMSIGMFFNKIFGRYFNKKKIPDFIYNWDRNMIDRLIEGLITSDGCISKEGSVSFTLSNKKLIKSLFSSFRNVGIMCSYSECSYLRKGATEKTARISFNLNDININNIIKYYNDNRLEDLYYKKSKEYSVMEIDGSKFIKIVDKFIDNTNHDYVYTLGIEDDHSYVVEGVLAENCFLQSVESDSIEGIFNSLKESAQISKNAGGIGIAFSHVRAKGTYISGTNGSSNGIIPFLKIFNETARAVDQCFTPNSKVITNNGLVNINEVKKGDSVLTSDGKFNKVLERKEFTKDDDFVIIKTKSGLNKVTKDHQILVIRNLPKDIEDSSIILGIKNGVYQIEWVSANELLKSDKIVKY